ncbi:hypothetical protein BKA62DRAFT_712797 [Auriculariales sp. MPI-PUGE-AT-0066]|nr:hypothetical protein BKA62DRAFT_712797 [Auriculariales sp. MPI-PUGE-AT-0066]
MSDGTRLGASWTASLNEAESTFRALSSAGGTWQRVPVPKRESSISSPISPATANGNAPRDPSDAAIHRRPSKRGDVYRVVLDVDSDTTLANLDAWRAILATPELRKEWDPAVESARLVELFDLETRIAKTNFTLGWPASPRDAITISRTLSNANTLIDIATSLPRSPDEPAYLRPAPPYVRSHIQLFAWCIQLPQPQSAQEPNGDRTRRPPGARIRVTCFWQQDLNTAWVGAPNLAQTLPAMVQGLVATVRARGLRVPYLNGFGAGVGVENVVFDIARESLLVEYHVIPDEDDEPPSAGMSIDAIRVRKRLHRAVEAMLPTPNEFSWDLQLVTQAPSSETARLPWTLRAVSSTEDYVALSAAHAPVPAHQILKVRLAIERAVGTGLRLNGVHHAIEDGRDPRPSLSEQQQQDGHSLLRDAQSMVSEISIGSVDSTASADSASTMSAARRRQNTLGRSAQEHAALAEKVVLTRVRRNYIYFSSLLQEPEAKWRRNSEARGVTITQLDSIDPTLVVYRAEAVFVGVGLWDLYSAITSPGARGVWDKSHEDATLLEDVNELTELWHMRTKAAWPVNARDAVLLKTVYKSPTTLHVFAFSTDDDKLFGSIPPASDPTTIRMQVDLQGWAIEQLSPTTTALTLLEQSDPKGWANKSSIPQMMIATVAGVGEFAIKSGGPPVLSRLGGGARKTAMRYDHEKGVFRVEYERKELPLLPSTSVPSAPGTPPNASTSSLPLLQPGPDQRQQMQYIECEIRCDLDTWASALDVVVDPPPQRVSCLRRHRLSGGGGGLWLTIEHDAVFAGEDRLMVLVRRAGRDAAKGAVFVNGAKVKVDVEELPEAEVKNLAKQKRVKPVRIPLDQPPVLGAIRKRREASGTAMLLNGTTPLISLPSSRSESPGRGAGSLASATSSASPTAPRFASPLSRFFTTAMEQASTAIGATTTAAMVETPLSADVHPMKYAVDKLAWLRRHHSRGPDHVSAPGPWTAVPEKGFNLYRALDPNISTVTPVHRAEKVIQGVAAEEVAAALVNYDCRKQWDSRFDSCAVLEEYAGGCHTAFLVSRGGYLFRDRGFYVANLTARLPDRDSSPSLSRRSTMTTPSTSSSSGTPGSTGPVIFHVSTSFAPESAARFDPAKYNSYNLPVGRMLVEGWVLETLDPYTSESYTIPSTRCTYLVSVDFAGSVPVAVNAMMNAALPRAILGLETFALKAKPSPLLRLPALGLSVNRIAEEDGDVWAVERKDRTRTAVATLFSAGSQTMRSTFLVRNKKSRPPVEPPVSRPAELVRAQTLPIPSEGHHRHMSRQENASTATVRQRTISNTSAGGPVRDAALLGLADPDDMLVGEVVVDLRLYPAGYNVQVCSVIQAEGDSEEPISLAPLQPANSQALPIVCHAFTLPPSPLAISSDRKVGARHLLRFTLRTALYDAPPVDDPLTGESHIAPPRPQWLTDLEQRSAVVDIVVKHRKSAMATKSVNEVLFNDAKVTVLGEKESLAALGRRELEDERLQSLPVLARVASESGETNDVGVLGLSTPLAVARDLLPDPEPPAEATAGVSEAGKSPLGEIAKGEPVAGVTTGIVVADRQAGAAVRSAGVFNSLFTNYSSWLAPGARPTGPDGSAVTEAGATGIAAAPPGAAAAPVGGDDNNLAVAPPPAQNGGAAGKAGRRARPRLQMMRRLDTRQVSLWTLLVVAFLSFLMGSLLRSLVLPSDFVYLPPKHALAADNGVGVGGEWRELQRLVELNHLDRWREMKRLIEFRGPLGQWDVVLAVIRRG